MSINLKLAAIITFSYFDPENRVREFEEDNNLSPAPMVHMAKNTGTVEERKAIVRRACPSSFCTNFIKKIKEYYR